MGSMMGKHTPRGFTIVELLIVIVVIGILAAITLVAYNGIQDRGRQSKIRSDIAMFSKAIQAARVQSGDVATRYITNSTGTAEGCVSTATNVDISDKTAAAYCWTQYNAALNAISNSSGINIRNLTDPWGRPYFFDENEKEGAGSCGIGQDVLGVFKLPRIQSDWTTNYYTLVPYVTPGC